MHDHSGAPAPLRTIGSTSGPASQRMDRIGWALVHRAADLDECWEWKGAHNTDGYGTMRGDHGEMVYVHRVSYLRWNGAIQDGLQVRHRCDNRTCLNPGHLDVGTAADNQADMRERGRGRRGSRTLTRADAEKIRLMSDEGHTAPDIARAFGISIRHVFYVKSGRSWGAAA